MAGAGRLTTHVLDTMHGKPARGMALDLHMVHGDHTHKLLESYTNADGRVDRPLLEGEHFHLATYELHFHVGQYFERIGVELETPFLDVVPIRFNDFRGQALSRAAARKSLCLLHLSGELSHD